MADTSAWDRGRGAIPAPSLFRDPESLSTYAVSNTGFAKINAKRSKICALAKSKSHFHRSILCVQVEHISKFSPELYYLADDPDRQELHLICGIILDIV